MRNEATQMLRFLPLERDKRKEAVTKLVVYSAWVFVCDALIKNLCGVLQGEQGRETLCVANRGEGKAPRYCLLSDLGRR